MRIVSFTCNLSLTLSCARITGVPPHRLDKIDVMTSFECLLRQLPLGQKSALYRLKHRLKSLCFSYIFGFDQQQVMNLTKPELDAFKSLVKNKNIAKCKPDKGNSVVVLDWSDYSAKMFKIISDSSKFVELQDDPTIKREKCLQEYFYYLKTKGVLMMLHIRKSDQMDPNLQESMDSQKYTRLGHLFDRLCLQLGLVLMNFQNFWLRYLNL